MAAEALTELFGADHRVAISSHGFSSFAHWSRMASTRPCRSRPTRMASTTSCSTCSWRRRFLSPRRGSGRSATTVPMPWWTSRPAFLNEVLDGFMCSVGMDFERGGQGANRREGLTWLKFTAYEGLLGGEYDLVDSGLARFKLEAQSCHMDTHVRGDVNGSLRRMRQPAAGPIVDLMLRASQRRIGKEAQSGGCGRAIGFRRNVPLLPTVRRVDSPYAYTRHSTS